MHRARWSTLLMIAGVMCYMAALAAEVSTQRPREAFPGILDEHPAIRYAEASTDEPVGRLAAAVARGEVVLRHSGPAGYLNSLLAALKISPDSQLLIFSKSGIQRAHTSPQNPRALYFNDDVVVGYIPGARYLEIAAHDPKQGVIFYTIDQQVPATEPSDRPDISRRTNCLTCHVSGATLDVPGLLKRSNFTNENGELLPQLGFHIVDHRTPLPQRWGGWFVTGKYDHAPYGGVSHMGNVATTLHPVTSAEAGTSNEIFHRWMQSDIAALGYPSHESDIAALMVFDHQAHAVNLLTRLNWEARVAAYEGRFDLAAPPLSTLIGDVVDYFLFVDEVPPPALLTPRPDFARSFMAAGPKDARGRSLRELDLETRLLKYSCSYMIDSPAFHALPSQVRDAVYGRIIDILRDPAAADPNGKYAHLVEHRTTLEILQSRHATAVHEAARRTRSFSKMFPS